MIPAWADWYAGGKDRPGQVNGWWNMADGTVIIKRIKKSGHGGHHGGAWKVAYADFVTAMMAFFLLMWLINTTTPEQKRGIADYFAPAIHRPDRLRLGRRAGRQGDGRGIRPCRRRPVGDAEAIAALTRLAREIAGQRRHRRRDRRQHQSTASPTTRRPRTANSPMPPKRSVRRSRTIPISPISPIK